MFIFYVEMKPIYLKITHNLTKRTENKYFSEKGKREQKEPMRNAPAPIMSVLYSDRQTFITTDCCCSAVRSVPLPNSSAH